MKQDSPICFIALLLNFSIALRSIYPFLLRATLSA